ncbi:MAG TPA: four-helix bundle copper-binding protein [Cytophagaceae bacterium]|nr:four-helix bundle copper-binding protein [Cytophagaceae bacterium]
MSTNAEKYYSCISICLECATHCAQAAFEGLKESEIKMLSRCIQLQRECAEMCLSTVRILNQGSEHARDVCVVCADYCNRCAIESEKHTDLNYCKICADMCRKCAEECNRIVFSHIHKN